MTQGYIYAKLVNDSIELILVVTTIILICITRLRSAHSRKGSAMSSTIKLQLALMFIQSILFTTVDSWQVANLQYEITDEFPWVYCTYTLAFQTFMMQHALFVGQYARVSLSLPFIFCV